MKKFITYCLAGAGVWHYEFCLNGKSFGNVVSRVSRSEPARIEGPGISWYSRFDMDRDIVPGVSWQSTVRKLLPVECERLMGFPDDHTRISWKGKPPEECPDAPRYKSCGNSMCVNVIAWIGHRIQAVEESIASRDAIPHEDVIITCDERVAERTEQLPL